MASGSPTSPVQFRSINVNQVYVHVRAEVYYKVIDLLSSLYRHQAWADQAILEAVQAHSESLRDQELFKILHHIVTVQRFFLSCCLQRPFDKEKAAQLPESFEQLVQLFRNTHTEELAFIDGLTETELKRRFELSFLGSRPTVAEGLTQAVMHSQNHRGQCLTRIRMNGGKPPTLDYILWASKHLADSTPYRGAASDESARA
jgi:uncharacterized damage-inducible protein DinB